MNQKKIIALLLSLVMLMSFTACGTKTVPAADVSAGPRDTVVIAIGDEPTTLDPTNGWGHGNAPIMQSTLVRYDAEFSGLRYKGIPCSGSDDGIQRYDCDCHR